MNLTTDKLRSMVKKWQTLIEAHVDVKTTDGYLLRVFCIGFTQKQSSSTKKHCYAQSQQIRQIRKKMVDIIAGEVSGKATTTTTDPTTGEVVERPEGYEPPVQEAANFGRQRHAYSLPNWIRKNTRVHASHF